jgi:hypothetical protein
MEAISTLALMREATRRVEADFIGALLVQVSSNESAEIPSSYVFWFTNLASNEPKVRTIMITYNQGSWEPITTTPESLLGALSNDLLRIEIDVAGAVGCIRAAGYGGPLFFGGLLQPLSHPIPPNPLYNFAPSPKAPTISSSMPSPARSRTNPVAQPGSHDTPTA